MTLRDLMSRFPRVVDDDSFLVEGDMTMIICDPRNAPWMSWLLGYRLQGIKYWVMLLFPLGKLRLPPWCGWSPILEVPPLALRKTTSTFSK